MSTRVRLASGQKMEVPRAETFALECAIRSYRNKNDMWNKLLQPGDDVDGKIEAAGNKILTDLRSLRRRIADDRPRQTYK